MYDVVPIPFDTHWENVEGELQTNWPGLQGRVRVDVATGELGVVRDDRAGVAEATIEGVLSMPVMGRIVVTMVLSVV
jgi:hypothetical protein